MKIVHSIQLDFADESAYLKKYIRILYPRTNPIQFLIKLEILLKMSVFRVKTRRMEQTNIAVETCFCIIPLMNWKLRMVYFAHHKSI